MTAIVVAQTMPAQVTVDIIHTHKHTVRNHVVHVLLMWYHVMTATVIVDIGQVPENAQTIPHT